MGMGSVGCMAITRAGEDEKQQQTECMVTARGSRSASIKVQITINYNARGKSCSKISLNLIKCTITKSRGGGTVNISIVSIPLESSHIC